MIFWDKSKKFKVMAFPLAHGFLGATIVVLTMQNSKKTNLKWVTIGAFLGILPDFDYFLNWIQVFGGGWHHGFSHSLFFAAIIGTIAAFAVNDFRIRTVLGFSAATASHGILDFFITESKGIALFSPLTNYRFKLELLNPIDYRWADENSLQTFSNVLRICLIEFIIFFPIFLIAIWLKRTFYKTQNSFIIWNK